MKTGFRRHFTVRYYFVL